MSGYNPIVYSGVVDEEGRVIIPRQEYEDGVSKLLIHFHVEAGCVEIYFNHDKNVPSLKLYEKAVWNVKNVNNRIKELIIKPYPDKTCKFKLWIIIEKLF